jgi:hypothetical protein
VRDIGVFLEPVETFEVVLDGVFEFIHGFIHDFVPEGLHFLHQFFHSSAF